MKKSIIISAILLLTAIGTTTAYYSAGKKCTGPKIVSTVSIVQKMSEVVGCVNNI
jgi:hypothetical protein